MTEIDTLSLEEQEQTQAKNLEKIAVTDDEKQAFRQELIDKGYTFVEKTESVEIPKIGRSDLATLLVQIEENVANELKLAGKSPEQVENGKIARVGGAKASVEGMLDYLAGEAIEDPHGMTTNERMAKRKEYEGGNKAAVYTEVYLNPNQFRPINMTKVITGLMVLSNELQSEQLEEKAMSWMMRNVTDDATYATFTTAEKQDIIREIEQDAIDCLSQIFPNAEREAVNITPGSEK
jgi:hypothetical protein